MFVLTTHLLFGSTALAANPVTLSGTCPDLITPFEFTVDIDAIGPDFQNSPSQSAHNLNTPVPTGCGSSITQIWTLNDSSCTDTTTFDGLLFYTGVQWFLLGDSTGTVLPNPDFPTSIDFADFDRSHAGTGSWCEVSNPLAGVSSGSTSSDMTLIERATDARDMSDLSYSSLHADAARLEDATTMETKLFRPVGMLLDAGCEVDGHIGGAYGASQTGTDQDGNLANLTLDRTNRLWGTDLSDSTVLSGVYNRNRQMFASDFGTEVSVGFYVRSRGIKGTFYGVTASCPDGTDLEATLGAWYRGSMDTI